MKKLLLLLTLLLCPLTVDGARRYPIPECPYTGHSTCSDGVDNDQDGTADEAAPSASLASVTDGFAANLASGQLLTYTSTADGEADSGNLASKTGTYRQGQIAVAGNITNGTYFVWLRARVASGTPENKRVVWVSITPFQGSFQNSEASLLFTSTNGISSIMSWSKVGAGLNFNGISSSHTANPHTTQHKSLALNGNSVIYITGDAAAKLDCIFLSTNAAANPVCPSDPVIPVAGSITVSNITETSFTASWDYDTESTDDGDCFLRYGLTTGNLDQTTATASSTSGTCSRTASGLNPGTIYFMRGTSQNANGFTETPETQAQTQVQTTGPIRWAVASGGSTTANCLSEGTPCTLSRALNQAVAGDTVLLKDGVYNHTGNVATVRSGTVSQPITIRAENKRQATIKLNLTASNNSRIFNVAHSNIIIKDLVFDGNGWSWDGLRIRCPDGVLCTGIIIENNRITNTGGKALGIHGRADGILLRWNTIDNVDPAGGATYSGNNSAMYLGSANPLPGDLVSNVELYANNVTLATQTFGENILDMKGNTRSFNVHHNIFEGLVDGNDGCFSLGANTGGHNLKFEDNIIKDSDCGSAVFDYTKQNGNQLIDSNVIRSISDGSWIWYRSGFGLANTVFSNNTLCSASSLVEVRGGGGSPTPSGITFTNNHLNQAAGVCDSEEARIISERNALPGNPNP